MAHFAFDAIGTNWQIDTDQSLDDDVRRRVLDLAGRFEATYSRFRTDTPVARLADAPQGGRVEFPAEAASMFDLYDRLHAATRGAVDPLVGAGLQRLGYDRDYSLRPAADACAANIERPCWARDVTRSGATIATSRPLTIDLGAVGKGFLVDCISCLLAGQGISDFTVDGSGDMHRRGSRMLEVGLEHPFDPALAIGIVRLRNTSLCASATNRRRWGDGLHHVIDGRTGLPTLDVVATWVIARDTATADGLATALFFVPGEALADKFDFSFVRMFAHGRAEISQNFDGELFN